MLEAAGAGISGEQTWPTEDEMGTYTEPDENANEKMRVATDHKVS